MPNGCCGCGKPIPAGLVDEALAALRARGTILGPPLVVPLEVPARPTRPDLDYAYQRQLEMLTRLRRAAADIATSRKRLELQMNQLEQQVAKLEVASARARRTQSGRAGPSRRARCR